MVVSVDMSDDGTAPPALRIGAVLDGRYRLEALLGEGGIGQVFEASHLALGTSVAVKVLRAEYAETELLQRRFQREAKALTELSHPHIVSVTDVGVSDGTPYLVMEKVEGQSLRQVLRGGALDPARALELTRQILRAVSHAHERDLVHRDLKPANIIVREVDGGDHATVLDFGLARYTGERGRQGTKLTRRGSVIGTPAYMAPEQAAGGEADERADVYALGLLAYEMLTGRRPFTELTRAELLRAHLLEPVPPLESASPGLEVMAELEDWIQRALAKQSDDRFADADEMLAELEALPRTAARRWASPVERPPDAPTPPDPTAETMPAAVAPPAVAPPGSGPRAGFGAPPPILASRPADAAASSTRAGRGNPFGLLGAAIVLAGGLFALAVGGVIMALVLSSTDDPSAQASSSVRPSPSDSPPTSSARRTPPETNPAGVDPMASLPPELASAHHQLTTGHHPLERRTVGQLNRYNRSHPRDARGRLLLGRHFTEVRSLSWAFPEYEAALELDADARRWPPVLPDLLEMARSRRWHSEAVALIAERYGAEALPEARAERARTRRPVEQRRIDALIARLAAAPRDRGANAER